MLWVAVSVFSAVIFPFLVSVKIDYDSNKNGAVFVLKLFNIIKIVSAKIVRSGSGIIIKFSEKKTKKINFLSFTDVNGAIKPFMDFHITSLKICVFKSGYDLISEYEKAYVFNFLLNSLVPVVRYNKPYFKAKSQINVAEGTNYFRLILSVNILFNILVILLTVIKSIWGKINGK